jgi:hypothetical protein
MSKFARFALVAALLLGLLVAVQTQVALAQNTKFTSYISGIQVANLDPASAALVSLQAIDAAGNNAGAASQRNIPIGGSTTFFPIENVAAGFNGSVVISSSKNVAAISNILGSGGSLGAGSGGASYVGRSGGTTTVLLPLLNKDNSGRTSWFSVQNAGNVDANVKVDYQLSNAPDVNFTIKPGAARVVYQAGEAHSVANFGAIVSSTNGQPIVAAVIVENGQQLLSYAGFAAPGVTNPVFPLVQANNAGTVTGVQIQNGGNVETTVTVSYSPLPNAGTACTETQTIPAGQSKTFAFLAFFKDGTAGITENCANAPTKFVGSARVTANTANQPLVGVVNQEGASTGASYNAFGDADAAATVILPLIVDRNAGDFTGINVQNVGAASVKIQCRFTRSGQNAPEAYTAEATVAPGAALNDLQFNKLGDRWVGSATCSGLNPSTNAADPAAKLVAVVNILNTFQPGDTLKTYEGIKR